MRILPFLVSILTFSCLFAHPASPGEGPQTVSLYADRKGDSGWVELDRTEGRMRATPYLRVSGNTVRGAMDTADRAGQARESAAADLQKPDPDGTADRKSPKREALSSLLEGPRGVSLGGILDLARKASESARGAIRQVRAGRVDPSAPQGDR